MERIQSTAFLLAAQALGVSPGLGRRSEMPEIPEFVKTIMERFAGQSTILQEHADKIEALLKDTAQLRGDALERITTGFAEIQKRIDDLAVLADAAKVAELLDGFTERMAAFGQRLSKLEDRFGEVYGKKLDALAGQVASLLKIGEDVGKAKAAAMKVTEILEAVDEHTGTIDDLFKRVEKIESALAPTQQPKETPAEEKARKGKRG